MSFKPQTMPLKPLDLSRWQKLPLLLTVIGGMGAVASAVLNPAQFGHSWLLAFMFYLSLSLGALFLVMVHHLFDAGWSVPLRRFVEQIACSSFPALLILFVPVAVLAKQIYPWLAQAKSTHGPASYPPLTFAGFCVTAAFCFFMWGFIAARLRFWSIKQDEDGSAICTRKMRFYSAIGIVLFAFTLSFAAVIWMKSLSPHWLSTMYGVWYFAGSVWATLAIVYLMMILLQRTGPLREVIGEEQHYLLGSLLLAFTIFYAYISFSQYLIIWSGNIPGETIWYAVRERGGWWWLSMVIIFGHFFVPFLLLLRIDWKLNLRIMGPLCVWALLMHCCDLQFQIMPALHPGGPTLWSVLTDLACLACIGGILTLLFLRSFQRSAPVPLRDPRLAESLGAHLPSTTHIAVAPERAK